MDAASQRSWVKASTYKKGSGIPALDSSEFCRCRCADCNSVHTDTAHWTSLQKPALNRQIRIGERVLVNGKQTGVVKYVGDLNSSYTNDQVYIGVKLDDPVGEHDGTYNGKRYFTCPDHHGVVVPIEAVHLLFKTEGKSSKQNECKNLPKGSKCASSTPSLIRDCSGLHTMLSKSWAQSRISAQSVQSCSFNASHHNESLENDTSASGHRGCKQVELVFSDEGDMIIEEVEECAVKTTSDEEPIAEKLENAEAKEMERGQEMDSQRDIHISLETVGLSRSRSLESAIPTTLTDADAGRPQTSIPAPRLSTNCLEREDPAKVVEILSSQLSGLSFVESCDEVRNQNRGNSAKSSTTSYTQSVLKEAKLLVASVESEPKHSPSCDDATTTQTSSEPDQPLSHVRRCPIPGVGSSRKPQSADSRDFVSPTLPPVPPGTAASSCCSEDQLKAYPLHNTDSLINGEVSYTRRLMSRLPQTDQTALPEADDQVDDMDAFGEVMEAWGGDVRAWLMASTYQTLKDALRKGEDEIQWQRKIREFEMTGQYPSQTRKIKVLRANIRLNRLATADVGKEIAGVRKRHRRRISKIAAVRAELECEQASTRALYSDIMSYPPSAGISRLQALAQAMILKLDKTDQ